MRGDVRCADSPNAVAAMLEGEECAAFEDHVAGCPECRALMVEVGRSCEVEETLVGRYIVLDQIGAGAMGVVYRAYDPDLDRDVALKLVAEVTREAQAMAKLAHPNVVAVYDAVTTRDVSFVAMELVEGSDLEVWLRTPRTHAEILRCFVQAGRGLAAAHDAGIIHRDFKPSNVLVGSDLRARVSDFGLARAASDVPARLAVCGTPAYMSPEVKRGEPADARSDQYSYALALCEALTGERAPTAALPRAVRPAIVRALSEDPSARWPTMDALVDALDPTTRRTWPWAVAVGAAAVAAASIITVVALGDDAPSTCAVPDRFGGIWDAPTKARIAATIPDAWPRVAASIDRFVAAWQASHVAACQATQRGEQSGALLDRRIACLNGERARLAATVELLTDATVAVRAAGAADLTDRLATCNDVALLDSTTQISPTLRVRAAAAKQALARVEVTALRGGHTDAITGARGVLDEAIATGDTRLEADARRSIGESQWRAGQLAASIQTLYEAVDAAKRARAPDLEGGALLVLVAVLGYEEARYDEALQVSRLAESTMRATGDESQLGRLLGNRAAIHYARSDFASARADYERSLALLEQAYGPNDRRVGQTLMNLAMVSADLSDDATEALGLYARALGILEASLGPTHFEVANLLSNRAVALANNARFAEAYADLERALSIRAATYPGAHRDIATTHRTWAEVAEEAGDTRVAIEHYRIAFTQLSALYRPDHPQLAIAYRGLGHAHAAARAWPEAIEALEHALAIWDTARIDGPLQAATRFSLARALWESRRDRNRARQLAARAHEALAAVPGQTELVEEIATWRTTRR